MQALEQRHDYCAPTSCDIQIDAGEPHTLTDPLTPYTRARPSKPVHPSTLRTFTDPAPEGGDKGVPLPPTGDAPKKIDAGYILYIGQAGWPAHDTEEQELRDILDHWKLMRSATDGPNPYQPRHTFANAEPDPLPINQVKRQSPMTPLQGQ